MEPQRPGLDRLRLNVVDLAAAEAALDRAGFATVPLEAPGWLGVVLPFAHLEFEAAEALGIAALGVVVEAEHPAANDAAAPTREVVGTARLAFAEAPIGAGELPLVRSRTLTPEALRPPAALRHTNGALAFVGATCVVADPEAVARDLALLCGQDVLTRTDGIVAARLGGATLLVAAASDAELLHPDLTDPPAEPVAGPRVVALAFEVADVERTATTLAERGQPVRRRADGSLGTTLPALGVAVEFRGRG